MAYGKFNLHEHNANNSGLRATIASNSLAAINGQPLTSKATGITIAAAGEDIVGISVTNRTFTSDNFTVAKAKAVYIPEPNINNTYILPIEGGTVTIADEGVSYYDIKVSGATYAADGTTESATDGTLILVRFISATLGEFRIVNKPTDAVV